MNNEEEKGEWRPDVYEDGSLSRSYSFYPNEEYYAETTTDANAKPLDKQVGGDHYKKFAIQPIEFVQKNKLNFCEGNIVKYICRHHNKGGVQDIDKVIHYAQMLKQMEYGE